MTATKKRPRQKYIKGMQPKMNKRVHEAALAFLDLTDEKKRLDKKVGECHDTLLYTMQEEKIDTYRYEDLLVRINLDKKCKVKRVPPEKVEKNGKPQ